MPLYHDVMFRTAELARAARLQGAAVLAQRCEDMIAERVNARLALHPANDELLPHVIDINRHFPGKALMIYGYEVVLDHSLAVDAWEIRP